MPDRKDQQNKAKEWIKDFEKKLCNRPECKKLGVHWCKRCNEESCNIFSEMISLRDTNITSLPFIRSLSDENEEEIEDAGFESKVEKFTNF